MTPIDADDQLAMDEITIVDNEAEEALEERYRAQRALKPYRRAYREAHDAARFAMERHAGEIPDGGSARVGRFRVSKRVVPGRSVAFATEERTQLSFATLDGLEDAGPPEQTVARFAPKRVTAVGVGRAAGYATVD